MHASHTPQARSNCDLHKRWSTRIVNSFDAYAEYDAGLEAYSGKVQVAREYLAIIARERRAKHEYQRALTRRGERVEALRKLLGDWTRFLELKLGDLDTPLRAIAGAHRLLALAAGEESDSEADGFEETILNALRKEVGTALEAAEASLRELQGAVHARTEVAYLRRRRALVIESFIFAYRDALAAVIGKHHALVQELSLSKRPGSTGEGRSPRAPVEEAKAEKSGSKDGEEGFPLREVGAGSFEAA